MRLSMSMSIAAVAFSLSAGACSTTHPISEAKVAVKGDHDTATRQDALNVIAEAICNRYDDCRQIGEQKKYSTKEDCLAKERAVWGNVWSADKCGEPKGVVVGKIEECKNRAGNWACGDSVMDLGGLVSNCGASDVCR